nr:unnamed protein product [Haemonchus contortus]
MKGLHRLFENDRVFESGRGFDSILWKLGEYTGRTANDGQLSELQCIPIGCVVAEESVPKNMKILRRRVYFYRRSCRDAVRTGTRS